MLQANLVRTTFKMPEFSLPSKKKKIFSIMPAHVQLNHSGSRLTANEAHKQ